MEASEAGTAPEQTAPAGDQTQAPQTGGQDTAPLMERFEEFSSKMGERFDALEGSLGGGQDAELDDGEPEVFTDGQGGYFDAYGNPVADPSQEQGGADQQAIQQQIDQRVQEALAPIQEHFKGQQLAALEQEFPEFRDQEAAGKVVAAADQMAAQLGHPELAEHPEFLKTMLLAQKAREAAKSEVPAGAEETGVQVESGSGSNPGAAELDEGDRIVQAMQKGSGFFS